MKRVALGVFLVLLLAPASVWAAKGSTPSVSFRLVRADARLTLRFYEQSADGTSINHGRVVTHVKGKPGGNGGLGPSGGKMRFPVKGTVLEHVRLIRKQWNIVTTCEQKRPVAAQGRIKFTPAGSKVRVKWVSPQAAVSYCPGAPTDSTLTAHINKVYPAAKFAHSVVTIKLSGHSSEHDGDLLQATYKWRIKLTLERVS